MSMKKVLKEKFDVSEHLVKIQFDQIHRAWGHGWKLLGDDLKKEIIAARVLFTFTGRPDEYTTNGSELLNHYHALCFYCGLYEGEDDA